MTRPKKNVCVWGERPHRCFFATGCGSEFASFYVSPRDRGFRYCPYCGKKVEVKSDEKGKA